MSEMPKTFQYSNSGQKIAVLLLVGVIIITVGFSVMNFFMQKDIDELQNKISSHKTSISSLESKKKVYIHALMKKHENILSVLDKRSNITEYIDHLDKIKNHYHLDLRGFQISNGVIETKVKIATNDTGIAYKKAVRFIDEYRSDDSALFDLNFISNFTGSDTDVKFPVTFTIK